MLAHDCLEFAAVSGLAAVVYPIGVKKQNVSRTHQCNLGNVSGGCPLAKLQCNISSTIWIIFGNLQAQRQELCHPALIDIHELAALSRKNQGRRMPEIHKTKMTVRANFAIEHRRDLTTTFVFTSAQRMACSHRLRQS